MIGNVVSAIQYKFNPERDLTTQSSIPVGTQLVKFTHFDLEEGVVWSFDLTGVDASQNGLWFSYGGTLGGVSVYTKDGVMFFRAGAGTGSAGASILAVAASRMNGDYNLTIEIANGKIKAWRDGKSLGEPVGTFTGNPTGQDSGTFMRTVTSGTVAGDNSPPTTAFTGYATCSDLRWHRRQTVRADVPDQASAPTLTGGLDSLVISFNPIDPADNGAMIMTWYWEIALESDPNTVIDSGSAITSNSVSLTPAVGVYVARAWVGNNVGQGPKSANSSPAVVFSVDSTAPVLSAASATYTSAVTAELTVTTDEGNGAISAVAVTVGGQPSFAQIEAGQDANGDTTPSSLRFVTTAGAKTLAFTGLDASTGYTVYVCHRDLASNQSNIVTGGSFTTPALPVTPATLSSPTDVKVDDTTATLTVTTDTASTSSDTLYAVVLPPAENPTAVQIAAGEDEAGNPTSQAYFQPVTATGVQTIGASSLSESTDYKAHFVQSTSGVLSNVVRGDGFTTDPTVAPPPPGGGSTDLTNSTGIIDLRANTYQYIDISGSSNLTLYVGKVIPGAVPTPVSNFYCIYGTGLSNVHIIIDGPVGNEDWRTFDGAYWTTVNHKCFAIDLIGDDITVEFTSRGNIQGIRTAIQIMGDNGTVRGSGDLNSPDVFGLNGDALNMWGDNMLLEYLVVREKLDPSGANVIHGDAFQSYTSGNIGSPFNRSYTGVIIRYNDIRAGVAADPLIGLSPYNIKTGPVYFGNQKGSTNRFINVHIHHNTVHSNGVHGIYNSTIYAGDIFMHDNVLVNPDGDIRYPKLECRYDPATANVDIRDNSATAILVNGAATNLGKIGNPPYLYTHP